MLLNGLVGTRLRKLDDFVLDTGVLDGRHDARDERGKHSSQLALPQSSIGNHVLGCHGPCGCKHTISLKALQRAEEEIDK